MFTWNSISGKNIYKRGGDGLSKICDIAGKSLLELTLYGTLDKHLWKTLEAAMGFTVPRGENGDTVTCPVAQLQGQSYQEWVCEAACQTPWLGPQKSG